MLRTIRSVDCHSFHRSMAKKRLESVVFCSVWLLLCMNLICLILSITHGARAWGALEACPSGASFLLWNALLAILCQGMIFQFICSKKQDDIFADDTSTDEKGFLATNDNLKQNLLRESSEARKTCIESTRLGILFAWMVWLSIGIYRIREQDDNNCGSVTKWMASAILIAFATISYNTAMGFCYVCLESRHRVTELRDTDQESEDSSDTSMNA